MRLAFLALPAVFLGGVLAGALAFGGQGQADPQPQSSASHAEADHTSTAAADGADSQEAPQPTDTPEPAETAAPEPTTAAAQAADPPATDDEHEHDPSPPAPPTGNSSDGSGPVYNANFASYCGLPAIGVGSQPGQPFFLGCYSNLNSGAGTALQGANSWVDDFDHGLLLADCCPGYMLLPDVTATGAAEVIFWRHANHMMVDEMYTDDADHAFGSAMRPSRSFRFEDKGDGRGPVLVVEFDVSARITSYDTDTGEAWPEFIISTLPDRADTGSGERYQMREYFANGGQMFGCRFRNEMLHEGIASIECEGDEGSGPTLYVDDDGNFCRSGIDPDAACRDSFRFEVGGNSLRVYVNGERVFNHNGPTASSALVNSDVYVYFGQFHYRLGESTSRWHWDGLAVNP